MSGMRLRRELIRHGVPLIPPPVVTFIAEKWNVWVEATQPNGQKYLWAIDRSPPVYIPPTLPSPNYQPLSWATDRGYGATITHVTGSPGFDIATINPGDLYVCLTHKRVLRFDLDTLGQQPGRFTCPVADCPTGFCRPRLNSHYY